MLVYMSTCRSGGETTLYERTPKGASSSKKNKQDASSRVIESVSPVYNTVLIFPHVYVAKQPKRMVLRSSTIFLSHTNIIFHARSWPHSGDLVQNDPKIALRVDLTLRDDA